MRNSPTEIIAEYTASAPVDLKGMIAALGIKLQFDSSLPPSIAGKLQTDPLAEAGFRIVVNANDNPRRQRFTMAHEVAHFVLHRDLLTDGVVDDALYRSAALDDGYERQADRLAGQLLLPATAVKEAYRLVKSYAKLSEIFEASADAIRIRLHELGCAP